MSFRTYLLSTICLLLVFESTELLVAQQYQNNLTVFCRKTINGSTNNYLIQIATDPDPNTLPDIGYGTHAVYPTGTANITNCNGDPYQVSVVSIDKTWFTTKVINGNAVNFDHTDNKRFWDWVYSGYSAPAQCDYSQNCHGFAFNKGDWPVTASPLIDQNAPGGSCYLPTSVDLATIATDINNHSIAVTGHKCPHPTYPGVFVNKVKTSEEQFRESGTYKQSATCPDGVNLNKAHTLAHFGWLDSNYTTPAFAYYK